jgi:hypothetical protein
MKDRQLSQPAALKAGSVMFEIWAINRNVSKEASTILIAATHHLHVSDALDQLVPPLLPLVRNGHYHEALCLRQVCEYLGKIDNKKRIDLKDEQIITELLAYDSRFEDETVEFLTTIVYQWRARKALLS